MDVRQTADYLHLNEKKIYALAGSGDIPATKVTGKWLFPRELIDKWILDSTHNGLLRDRLMLAGSDDPLLHNVINQISESLGGHALISFSATTSRNSLELLNGNKINIAIINWGPDDESHTRHPALIQQFNASRNWVLIRLFRRERGLMLTPEIAENTIDLKKILEAHYRWNIPPQGSGSQRWLMESLSKYGINIDQLNATSTSRSLFEAAAALNRNECDVSPGIRSIAKEFKLEFISHGWEHLDMVMSRDIWFRHLFQTLIDSFHSEEHRHLTRKLEGYDLQNCGKLLWGDD